MVKKYTIVTKGKKAEATQLMNTEQIRACSVAIHAAAAASATAGFIPIPVADALPISAAQLTMVLVLGKVFNQKVTESAAKGMIAATASTFVGRNIVKLIPVLGWGISSAVAAGVTEAVGWTIAVDFARQAKSKWEQEDTLNDDGGKEARSAAEDESAQIVDNLEERLKPFIDGRKKVSTNKAEYEELIKDFEKVLDYIDEKNPLRKMYDDLCLLDL